MASKLNPVTLVLRATDRVTGTVNKISTRLKAMQAPIRGLSKAFSELDKQMGIGKVLGKARDLATSFGRLARRALVAGTAIGIAAVAGMLRFISSADALDEAAEAAGVSVEKLQEARFAGSFAGIGDEQIDKMLIRFSRTLGEVRRGTGSFTAALKKSNPELLKQFKAVTSVDEGFDLFMSTLRAIPDQRLRNVFAVAAAGKGAERLTLLAAGYEEAAQRARDFGVVMDRQTVDQAVKAQDALQNLGAVVRGLGIMVGSALLPVVLEITEKVSAWVNQNRELIRTEVPKFARAVAEQVRELATWLADAIPKVVDFVDSIGGLKTVLAAIAAVIVGPVLASLIALSAALIATPFGWVILGIAAAAAGFAFLVTKWDAISEALRNDPLIGWLVRAISGGSSLLSGGASLLSAGANLVQGNVFARPQAAPNGHIRIEASGVPWKLKEMSSSGVDLSFRNGPIMSGN